MLVYVRFVFVFIFPTDAGAHLGGSSMTIYLSLVKATAER